MKITQELEKYITDVLGKIAVIDEPNVAYEDVTVFEFKTAHENKEPFTDGKGNLYGILFLNAMLTESTRKIANEIKKNKKLKVEDLKELVRKHRLKCYIKGDTDSFKNLKIGDKGIVHLEADDDAKTLIPVFNKE